jgi:hypothetical protein
VADAHHARVAAAATQALVLPRAGGLSAVGAAVALGVSAQYDTGVTATTWRSYVAACSQYGSSPLPFQHDSVAGFLAWYVAVPSSSHTGQPGGFRSSKYTRRALCALRRFAVAHDLGWVSEPEQTSLESIAAALTKAFPSGYRQPDAIRLHHLPSVRAALEREVATGRAASLWAQQVWAIFTVAHHAMLRPCEYIDGHLTDADVARLAPAPGYPHGAYQLCVVRSKADKESTSGVTAYVWPRAPAYCAVRALDNYLPAIRAAAGGLPHALFPALDRRGRLISHSYSAIGLRILVREVLALSGLPNSQLFSARSFRYGGAIDLRLEGLPLDVVQRLGRWRSGSMLALYTLQTRHDVLGLIPTDPASAWNY